MEKNITSATIQEQETATRADKSSCQVMRPGDGETIMIKVDPAFKNAIAFEAKRQHTTMTGLIKRRMLFCLPENIAKQICNE